MGIYVNNEKIYSHSVIISTGTFLNGTLHIANSKSVGGRFKVKHVIISREIH